MIRFKDILNELEIQPNIPDPIRRKGLHVGDVIEWKYFNYQLNQEIEKTSTITHIEYNMYDIYTNDEDQEEQCSVGDKVGSWKEADLVTVITKNDNDNHYPHFPTFFYYHKNPEYLKTTFRSDIGEEDNKQFETIQKIK